ncbi:MAG: hypothetical protein COA65_08900 [Rhodospirillaceae bacterium]|nr:MAG: hypothetical protein COA65_08900 [Rhodospirillaceae bacterium]
MIGEIEQAIIDVIQGASDSGVLGYRFKEVASYGDQLHDANKIKQISNAYPAVWVVFAGEAKPEFGPGEKYRHAPVFTLFICQKSRRNETASRRGAGSKVGSYQMLKDVRALLARQTLGLDIEPIAPGAVRSVINGSLQGKSASVYALEIHTIYESNQPDLTAGNPGDFATFHSDWDIPPHGNVVAPLPTAEADARDDIKPEII